MATLQSLKTQAAELGLTPDDVRKHGDLRCTATWQAAVDAAAVVAQPEPEPEPVKVGDLVFDKIETVPGVVVGLTRGGQVLVRSLISGRVCKLDRSDISPLQSAVPLRPHWQYGQAGGRSPPIVS